MDTNLGDKIMKSVEKAQNCGLEITDGAFYTYKNNNLTQCCPLMAYIIDNENGFENDAYKTLSESDLNLYIGSSKISGLEMKSFYAGYDNLINISQELDLVPEFYELGRKMRFTCKP